MTSPGNPAGSEWALEPTGDYYLTQIKSIRRLRFWATVVAVLALGSLAWALWKTINAYTSQIEKATASISQKAVVSTGKLEKTPVAAVVAATAAVKPLSSTSSVAKAVVPVAVPMSVVAEPVAVPTAVILDVSSMGNSVIAVVSVLVVAIAVLAISLLRITYTLSVESVKGSSASSPAVVDSSLPLPGLELLKAAAEALATVLKGLPGK